MSVIFLTTETRIYPIGFKEPSINNPKPDWCRLHYFTKLKLELEYGISVSAILLEALISKDYEIDAKIDALFLFGPALLNKKYT